MEVIDIQPRGYCYGVINALNIVKETKKQYPNEKIYILGMIVHNKYIVEALKQLQVVSLDDDNLSKEELINNIDEGVLIFTAHGSAESLKKQALDKGLIVVDATCPDVVKTHDLIKEYLSNGYDIIYLGKSNHPEAEGTIAIDKERIHLINNIDELKELDLNNDKILMTNQTTISIVEAKDIFEYAKIKYPNIIINEEICNATRIRQEAILNLADDIDLVIIIGDVKSNNTTKLYKIAQNKGFKAIMIESIDDLDINDLVDVKKVAITAGASTPTYIINQVSNYLKDYENNPNKPTIEMDKIL